MIYAAKIENGLVVQVTVEPTDFVAPEGWAVIGDENVVGIGWSFDGGFFFPPKIDLDDNELDHQT